jgi:alkylation response protein AidB-like acyl-CoA dehydrogenase
MLERLGKGKDPGFALLMTKLIATDVFHEACALYVEVAGDGALAEPTPSSLYSIADTSGEWNAVYLLSLGFAIAAGTSNIQRKVIAERGLGLPRDHAR